MSLNGVDIGDSLLSFLSFTLILKVDELWEAETLISKQHMLVWLYSDLANNHHEANILLCNRQLIRITIKAES